MRTLLALMAFLCLAVTVSAEEDSRWVLIGSGPTEIGHLTLYIDEASIKTSENGMRVWTKGTWSPPMGGGDRTVDETHTRIIVNCQSGAIRELESILYYKGEKKVALDLRNESIWWTPGSEGPESPGFLLFVDVVKNVCDKVESEHPSK